MNTEKNVIVLYGSSEFHERLTFTKPAPAEIADNVASYCDELVYRINNCRDEEELRINAYITVNGIRTDISDEKAFVAAAKALRNAENFEFDADLDVHYISAIYNENPEDDEEGDGTGEVQTWLDNGLHSYIASLEGVDGFEYKQIEFYPNSGEFGYRKIKDCKYVDVNALANKEFPLSVKDMTPWWSYNMGMAYSVDSITSEQAEKVHEIVRKYLPESEIQYCTDYWEDDNSIILGCVQWEPESFRQVSDFIDEINAVVEIPEENIREYELCATYFNAWFDMRNFGIVFMEEVNGKFVLLGTDF